MFPPGASIRNLLGIAFWNLTADGVRLLAMMNFLLHSCAGDGSHFGAWNPTFAANGTAGLFANRAAATGLVAGTAGARIVFTGAWVADALLNDGTRNLFRFRHPIARAEWNLLRFADGLAGRIANVAVAGLSFRTITGTTNVAVLRFADGFADRAANVAVAGLEAGLADRAAHITIARLITGFANGAANVAIARLDAGLADRATDIAIACLIDRLANSETFVPVARLVDVAGARYRNLFCALFVNRSAAIDSLLFVNGFANRTIAGSAAALCSAIIAARSTSSRGATLVTGRPAIGGFYSCVRCECQHTR